MASAAEIKRIYELAGKPLPESGPEWVKAWEQWSGKGVDELSRALLGEDYRQAEAAADPAAAAKQLQDEIANVLIDIDEKLSNIPLALTDKEREDILNKAIQQVTPYYEKKRKEIEKGIREGKIRSAEDVLTEIRRVRDETSSLLKKYDVSQARTEEELANTLADITATTQEELALKRDDWRRRIEEAKKGEVQQGILTSGVGKKYITDLLTRKQMEEAALQRRAQQSQTEAQTAAKYDLKQIALAREAVEKERLRRLGTPQQEQQTIAKATQTLGISGLGRLPSETAIAQRRGEQPITIYKPEALTAIEEERKRAIESRRGELESDTLAQRRQEYELRKKKILSEAAKQHKNLAQYLLG